MYTLGKLEISQILFLAIRKELHGLYAEESLLIGYFNIRKINLTIRYTIIKTYFLISIKLITQKAKFLA